jgi:hypothetical protein
MPKQINHINMYLKEYIQVNYEASIWKFLVDIFLLTEHARLFFVYFSHYISV